MSISNRLCQRCRTVLDPNELFCNNCGTHYVEQGTPDLTHLSSSSSGTPSQSAIESTQYAGPSSAHSSSYGSSAYGSPNTSYRSPGYAPPPPSNIAYRAPGVYGQQQFGAASPQAPRPKKSPAFIIGSIAVVVLLIGGGLLFLSKTGGSTPTHVVNGTTSTALPLPPALFSDNFANNSKGWLVGNGNGFSRTLGNHTLTLAENNQGRILPEGIPTTPTYTDFTVTATFTLPQGDQNDSAGLYMRGDSNLDHDYRLDINGDNTYAIAREFTDPDKTANQQFLVKPTTSPAIKPLGQQNTITVIMKGHQIVLLINSTVVVSVSDTNYMSGQIALYAAHGETSSGTKVSFTSIAVYPAPSQLPQGH